MVAHTFYPSIQEAEAGKLLSLKPDRFKNHSESQASQGCIVKDIHWQLDVFLKT